jgi:hypothetical protein
VLILFGSEDLLPHCRLALTSTGALTMRTRTAHERNAFYVEALGSAVLATVKKGFAALPGATELRVVVLRRDPGASSPADLEWIYAGNFPRHWAARLPWNALNPSQILLNAPGAKMHRGAEGSVAGMPLSGQPGLSEIVSAVREAV